MENDRRIYLCGEIDIETASQCAIEILGYNRDDLDGTGDGSPIIIYIMSNGGDEMAGAAIIDAINCSNTPVYTVNIGIEFSMALLIGIAGDKRYAMPNSRFLLHEGEIEVVDSKSKLLDCLNFLTAIDFKNRSYILSKTKISPEIYSKAYRKEWYMFADEAKKLGIIDYIVGVDCDINEIL